MRKTSGQLKLKRKPVFISGEKEKEILEYFKSNHDNRTSVVAKHFEVSEHQVSRIIDVHFDRTRIKK
jgi:DNA-directed RNA polymerase specialized sigma subunit